MSASSNLLRQKLNRTSFLRVFIQRTLDEIFHVDPVRRRPAARQAHARYREQNCAMCVKIGQALVCKIDATPERGGQSEAECER